MRIHADPDPQPCGRQNIFFFWFCRQLKLYLKKCDLSYSQMHDVYAFVVVKLKKDKLVFS